MTTTTIPVRRGPYQYVRVAADGATTPIRVDPSALDAGALEVDVRDGETVTEIALSSTSDPDLDPARGQLWPKDVA